MKRYALNTPEGMRDRLYEICQDRLNVDQTLETLFMRRGYSRVLTPTVEYYDVFLQSGNIMPQEEVVKLMEGSGRLLVLRPDMTIPIARIAASRLGAETFPQRLSYLAPVFRLDRENMGRSFEVMQAGVELLGAGGEKADLEIVSLAVDALESCGFPEFYFGLGHVGIVKALVDQLGVEEETRETLCRLMAEENYPALDDFLTPYRDHPACEVLRKLPLLFGGEEIFEQAEGLLQEVPAALEAMESLRSLFEALKAAGYGNRVKLDFSLMNQIDYYTGILFHGIVPGAGAAVLTGGRYDDLIGAFGRPMPAAGFAVNTDAVAACLPGTKRAQPEALLYFTAETFRQASELLEKAPAGTYVLSCDETLEKALEQAREKKIEKVLAIENGVREIEVRL